MRAILSSWIGTTSSLNSAKNSAPPIPTLPPLTSWSLQLITKRTQSVDNYLDEFLDLIMESGYTDPKTLVVQFRKGLDPQIQNAVATMTNGCSSDTALTA